ncbi:MAG: peptidoglycan-associated lipoprotein Pal [Syntrophales bacterium]|nr:peptidoglycan-associated lipoprotein Pal [Syntrophales bacterium]
MLNRKKGRWNLGMVFIMVLFLMLSSCAKKSAVTEVPEQKAVEPKKESVSETPKPKAVVEEKAKTPALEPLMEKKEVAKEAPAVKESPITEEKKAVSTEAKPVAKVELRDINFDFDKYNIRPDAREILKEHAEWLMKNPEVRILIEGHCDERGTNEYNLALGEKRANETKKYLIELGISADRIETISYGEERPLDPRHCEEAWAKNRRAHFVIK